MKTYKIEFKEIYDPEYEEISDIFNSFKCKVWEDNKFLAEITLSGCNKLFGLSSLIGMLYKKLGGKEDFSD